MWGSADLVSGGHPKGLIVSVLHQDKGRPEVFEATGFALRDSKAKDEGNPLGVKSCQEEIGIL